MRTDLKLLAARRLLAEGKVVPGMSLIIEACEQDPKRVDATLLATLPLWKSVVKHLAAKQCKFEDEWNQD